MILTCPRCATRYLADPLQVWVSGRTVECDACGQRWRAVGEGVRPPPEPAAPVSATPPSEARSDDPAAAVADAAAEPLPPVSPPGQAGAPDIRPPEGSAPSVASDWHATLRDAAPASGEPGDAAMFKRPAAPLTSPFRAARAGAGRPLAIAFLVIIAVTAFLLFRDAILQVLPGLGPVYAAIGLLPHPAAIPHG